MKFNYGYCSDIGIEKEINEDSLLISSAITSKGRIFLALVCDGMGGLSNGELASGTVIKRFSDWFVDDLPAILKNKFFKLDNLQDPLTRVLKELNQRILFYGHQNKINLGTTATGIVVFNNQYLIFHVGDTRIYQINQEIVQITEDQTWLNDVLKHNTFSKEEAYKDPRKNALLQCIGASKTVIPDFYYGKVRNGDLYLICSDGFRHMVNKNEIFKELIFKLFVSKEEITNKLQRLIELNKKRNETDNITALAFQCYEEE